MNKSLKAGLVSLLLAASTPNLSAYDGRVGYKPIQHGSKAIQTIISLEDTLKENAAKDTGMPASQFKVWKNDYVKGNVPFGDEYRGGEYILASSKDSEGTEHHVIFSKEGNYLGHLYSVKGEKNTWIAEEKYSPAGKVHSRVKYRKTKGEREEIYYESRSWDDVITRSYVPSPVEGFSGNRFVPDKPYSGVYGGEGEHCLNDGRKRPGLFFNIQSETLDESGKVIQENGELFKLKNEYNCDSIAVIRKNGKFLPSNIEDYRSDSVDYLTAFRNMVPKNMRAEIKKQ